MPANAQTVTLTLARIEALALERAADVCVRVIEALNLVSNPTTTDAALRKLRAAIR
jgi:hypothetical protein